jgi:hypoxanthine phosphoribosyltransferase
MSPHEEIKVVRFSHVAEEMFARILDFYGVVWQYEPKTFDLEWNDKGKVKLAFAPDFYLPDQDLFVELTTLRPQLATIKNKKLRLMNELYPDIKIKLMKRRDIRDLLIKYGLYDEAQNFHGTDAQEVKSG